MKLETSRLRLRPWALDDLDDYARIFAKAESLAFQLDRGLTRAEAEQYLRFHIDAWTRHPFGAWAIRPKATGRPVGWVSLETTESFPPAPDGVQIGWRLDPGEWGKGYATEAARAVLAYGFTTLGLPEIYVLFHRDNTPSARVAAKLGATPLTTITDEAGAHLREVHVIRRPTAFRSP
ncbi:GNAT family N-acetyltransferase [Actinoplanes sp. NPDC051633]|uniref:GNAT family N-acetyltransferase n=1 Tax=Actinoplanes sp. NPDC051633 TaxID=3155670 RepID=UPI00342509F8